MTKIKRTIDTRLQAKVGEYNTTVRGHLHKDTDKTFNGSVQKLIINNYLEKQK